MSRLILCLIMLLAASASRAAREDEFLRVAKDHWSFETRGSKTRFIPFGTNFVLNEKKYLNMFGPEVYDRERYERALAALEDLRFNLVKVFLPIANVLPDPQTPGEAHIAPGYLENLDDFLKLARKHHLRVVVSLTEWGGNGIKWWHDGGEYFGRRPWHTDEGIDSLEVLSRFWTEFCKRYRNNPTVFSYTPAVEWTFPADNLTWTHPSKQWGRLDTEQGLFYWRAFLRARYENKVADLNERYGANYADFGDVPLVDFEYNFTTHQYADPDAKIVDYQNFREWASRRYFEPQIAAIRRADSNHMVTLSNHMRRPIGLWEGAARYFIGFSEPEQSDLVDYLTSHENHSESELKPGQSFDEVIRAAVLSMRFCNAFEKKPLVVEELTFASPDPQKVADAQSTMVLGLVGHVSGWMNWYLQYPHDANEADTPGQDRSAILGDDLRPTLWGLRARDLFRELQITDLSRRPSKTIIKTDREKELAPHGLGTLLTLCGNWDKYQHPIDFTWPRNEWIDMRLLEER